MDKKDNDLESTNIKEYINNFYNNEVYNNSNDYGLYDRQVKSEDIKIKKDNVNSSSKYKFKNYSNEYQYKGNYKSNNSLDNETKIKKKNKKKSRKNILNKKKSKRMKSKSLKVNYKRIITIIGVFVLFIVALWYLEDSKKIRIIIDAGHGGNDTGAIYNERYEKDDTLDLSLLIYNRLKNEDDFKVILSRKNDTYLSLEERVNFGNRKKAKLFVSIHRNDAEVGNGVEIWIPNEPTDNEKEIANHIMNELSKTNISRNRGVKEGTSSSVDSDFYINKYFKNDSMIVELGFISNTLDNNLFDQNKEEYADKIAGVIKQAFYKYYYIEE